MKKNIKNVVNIINNKFCKKGDLNTRRFYCILLLKNKIEDNNSLYS